MNVREKAEETGGLCLLHRGFPCTLMMMMIRLMPLIVNKTFHTP